MKRRKVTKMVIAVVACVFFGTFGTSKIQEQLCNTIFNDPNISSDLWLKCTYNV